MGQNSGMAKPLPHEVTRDLVPLIEREIQRHKKSLLLLGPRQVGKSTLLSSFDPALKINLADEGTYREYLRDAGLLRRQVEALGKGKILIDEIQRLPELLNTVQALIDEDRERVFLLTGSSARKLRRGQANLLPGRVFLHYLYPLTFWELGERFDLDRALTVGTLPEPYLHPEYGADLLTSYIDIYLREEIQAEALVRDLPSYARFLDVAAEVSGQIVNYSQLASDSEIPKETIRRYVDLLADTLLIHRLPAYDKSKGVRKVIQREKILFFDLGARNSILRRHKTQPTPTEKGHLFEQWLIQQLIAFSSYHAKDWKFFHYRDYLKNEVDLIIETPQGLRAIEIKHSESFQPKWIKGLMEFEKVCGREVSMTLVYLGKTRQRLDGVDVIPYAEFLKELS